MEEPQLCTECPVEWRTCPQWLHICSYSVC